MPFHNLMLTHIAGVTNHHFITLQKAQSAYDKIKVAMAEYKEFGNDKDKTVEVELESGHYTIRLHHAVAVTLSIGDDKLEKIFQAEHDRQKKLFSVKKKK